ncbi:MAG TPA: dihydroorotate dehydrogenase electron transfer subunit [Spirochaetia bacterium]|nr:dihydroorotate dehydrogenase electron transfer subunit [Spirochaetia bacterium]
MIAHASVPTPFRVKEKIQENSRTVSFVLDGSLPCAPGQFAMLWLPGVDEKPFSISGNDPLMFTVSQVGPFSEALHALCPRDTLWVRGPFGRGFSPGSGKVLLVGGGYGAAPLAFLARALLTPGSGSSVEAALGARTAKDLLFIQRFQEMRVPVHAATEDGSEGTTGLVTEVVQRLLKGGCFTRVHACGPEGMLEALEEVCSRAGVPAELSYEAYMRCGVGLCGACEHGGRLVCMDGPVFSVGEARGVGPTVLRS